VLKGAVGYTNCGGLRYGTELRKVDRVPRNLL
jgi:hypothetical protein